MKRLAFFLCAASLTSTLPTGFARADDFDNLGRAHGEDYHSPQHFALELKGGPYSPDIDSTPNLLDPITHSQGKPFSDLFNSQYGTNVGKRPAGKPLITVEFDWQFWHPFGSFALAVSAGVQHRSTHAFQYADPATETPCVARSTAPNCTRSGD